MLYCLTWRQASTVFFGFAPGRSKKATKKYRQGQQPIVTFLLSEMKCGCEEVSQRVTENEKVQQSVEWAKK